MSIKRVVAVGDIHAGHLIGLNGPPWQQQIKEAVADRNKRNKYSKISRALWREFTKMLKDLAAERKIDVLLVNGDAIDGTGFRSGGTEQITTDRLEQAEIAAHTINHTRIFGKPKMSIVMTFGTPYHTGMGEDFETVVADKVGAVKIGSHEWPEVNGCVFDLKHHIGNTSVPYGKGTALSKTRLQNTLWALEEMQPKSKIVLRSHVHRYAGVDDVDGMGFTLPALCGMGSKFGARICEGIVHFGLMYFDIDHHGNVVNWDKKIVKIKEQRATTTVL